MYSEKLYDPSITFAAYSGGDSFETKFSCSLNINAFFLFIFSFFFTENKLKVPILFPVILRDDGGVKKKRQK